MLTVAAFYHFAALPDPGAHQRPLARLACGHGVRGSILLAPEGVNGTIAGTAPDVAAVLDHIRAWPGFAALEWKESPAADMPFGRLKVRLKREIVTMGQPGVDPAARVGRHVEARDWNALITAPDVAVIDTRNDYEVRIGTFAGAIDPGTESFSAFPDWWQENREALQGKRLAMFCTGGIRCEKATSWLVAQGVEEVYHLKGGILKYLEEVPEDESLWQGGCFVFDQRVAVGHGLETTGHGLCHGCRAPLTPGDFAHPAYEEGVQCPHCTGRASPDTLARRRERQRQITLARDRGALHLGG